MLSPTLVKVINVLPESLVVKITKVIVNKYFKKYANIKIEGFERQVELKYLYAII